MLKRVGGKKEKKEEDGEIKRESEKEKDYKEERNSLLA